MMGSGEILVILVVILILFGGKRLPEFAQSLGKGIREFKKACSGEEKSILSKEVKQNESQSLLHDFSYARILGRLLGPYRRFALYPSPITRSDRDRLCFSLHIL
jgi:sec-independent protein translocase protein TatA